MKEIFYINDTPANKISYYLLLVFLVTLPFDRVYSELALIGLLLHTLLHPGLVGRRAGQGDGTRRSGPDGLGRRSGWGGWVRWSGWLIGGLFLLMAVCSLYAPGFGDAGKQLEKQLALLLFPVIAWLSRLDWNRVRRPLLSAFSIVCLFTVLYLYGCALVSIWSAHLPISAIFGPLYLNHAFTAPIDLHATYFSMDVTVALVVFLQLAVKEKKVLIRLLYGLATLILLAAVLQLASRAVFLAVFVIYIGLTPWLLFRGRARWVALFAFVLLSVLSVVLVAVNKDLSMRYLVQLKQDMQGVTGRVEDPEPRMVRWGCAWDLIRQSLWIGYGTGAEVGRLKEAYAAHHLVISYTHELNAHNQYLSYLLNAGLPGVLLYLGLLASGGVAAWRRRDVLMGSFLVVVVLVSFSENILDTNKGIFFFSVFFTLFLYPVAREGVPHE